MTDAFIVLFGICCILIALAALVAYQRKVLAACVLLAIVIVVSFGSTAYSADILSYGRDSPNDALESETPYSGTSELNISFIANDGGIGFFLIVREVRGGEARIYISLVKEIPKELFSLIDGREPSAVTPFPPGNSTNPDPGPDPGIIIQAD